MFAGHGAAALAGGLKRRMVRHPLWFCALFAVVWTLLVEPGRAVLPLLVIAVLGWWRETGLAAWRPRQQWVLALPPVALVLPQLGSVPPTPFLTVLGVELARSVAWFALRWHNAWAVSAGVAIAFAAADPTWSGLATGFALTALRYRTPSLWPLLALHLVLPGTWWAATALFAYGCWLLHTRPTIDLTRRPSVRVLCLDDRRRVLLARWHDPADGSTVWDLPGGGTEPGETPLQAARRELTEETGLPGTAVRDRHVLLRRDRPWNGSRLVSAEPCFLARTSDPPPVSRAGLEPHERELLRELRWVRPEHAERLPGRVQLPDLAGLTAALADRARA